MSPSNSRIKRTVILPLVGGLVVGGMVDGAGDKIMKNVI